MEPKANGRSQALILGLFVNLVLTLGSIAFTYYSLHRFDSRLTAVEQNLQLTSSPDQLADRVIAQPTFKQSSPSGPQMKEDDRVKRAANRQFMCHKCSSACLKSIGHRNVSFFFASMHHKALRPLQCFEFLKLGKSYPDEKEKSNIARKKR